MSQKVAQSILGYPQTCRLPARLDYIYFEFISGVTPCRL